MAADESNAVSCGGRSPTRLTQSRIPFEHWSVNCSDSWKNSFGTDIAVFEDGVFNNHHEGDPHVVLVGAEFGGDHMKDAYLPIKPH